MEPSMGTMSRRVCPDIAERTGSRDVSGYLSGVACALSGVSVGRVRISVGKPIRTHGGYVGTPCPDIGDQVPPIEEVGGYLIGVVCGHLAAHSSASLGVWGSPR